tara:strand:+ start:3050 stop:3361 length:312 start_codon:yes stop_codon:yes gene_type:complete
MAKKRFKSKELLLQVIEMPCCVRNNSCAGLTQAHHLLKPWIDGRGMGMKATDRNVVPLCQHHHTSLHTKFGNEFKFFQAHFRPETYGQTLAKDIYEEFTGAEG